ncbi:MAG: DUF2953 domain-containing protein [Butyricicoccus sp.]
MIGLVLRIIGIVLLVLLCLFLLLGVVLLNLPLRIQARKAISPDAPLRIRLSAGPLHITKRIGGKAQPSAGRKKKKRRKPKKQEKTQPKPESEQEKRGLQERLQKLDMERTLALMLDLMDDLAGSITFERLHVTVILQTGDAGRTGRLLGGLSAVTGLIYPILEQNFVLKDPKIVLDADFDAERTVWSIDISAMTRMIRYPRIMWRRRKELWALWKSIK